MKVLFWGLFIFCLTFFIHLIIWKIRIPKGQIKLLLKLFFFVLAMSLFFLWFISSLNSNFAIYVPEGFLAYIHIALFVISLALVYITTYSALEADSPSLVMVMNIAKAGIQGLSKEELETSLDDNLLIKPRIKDLIESKMISIDKNDRYTITQRGIFFIRIFIFYRNLLRLDKGG